MNKTLEQVLSEAGFSIEDYPAHADGTPMLISEMPKSWTKFPIVQAAKKWAKL